MSAAEENVREMTGDQSMVSMVSNAEISQQIATAHAYPRSLKKFRAQCLEMATLTEQIADECIYALPRKEGGVTKMIEGPSARLAEIVVSAWGNCRAGARVIEEGREFVVAQGVFHDLERNSAITYEVRRRITNREGRRFSADMISVTANAACSIALRNAVFKGVPKAFWNDIYDAARKTVAGDSKTLANRRSEALQHFQKLGATQERILATLGVAGIEDISLDHLTTLRGLANAVKEGELTVEEAFAPKEATAQAGATTSRADAAKTALGAAGTAASPGAGAASGKESPAAVADSDYIAMYDVKGAQGLIKAAKTPESLEKAWKSVVDDFRLSNRELPVELDGAYTDRKAALSQL
ncbi:MAG: hypothetical protein RLZZ200_512 [Pseudomonadota bacterium]|jgi:hypothetical protein